MLPERIRSLVREYLLNLFCLFKIQILLLLSILKSTIPVEDLNADVTDVEVLILSHLIIAELSEER